MTTIRRAVLVVVVLLVAGCTGLPGNPTTPPDPPLGAEAAEERALDAEHDHVFAEKVPEDATNRGVGGLASPKAIAVAATDAGQIVRVRYGFWYETNTSTGTLHADGVSHAVYFVTPDDTTRISYGGEMLAGEEATGPDASLELHLVNAANASHEVSVAVTASETTHYEATATLAGGTSARSPRLAVPGDEATIEATVDGTTKRLTVTLPADGDPADVLVYVTPDGTVVVTESPTTL